MEDFVAETFVVGALTRVFTLPALLSALLDMLVAEAVGMKIAVAEKRKRRKGGRR